MFQVRDGVMRALLRLSIGTNLPIALFALLAAVILVALGATSLVAFTDSEETRTTGQLWWKETTTTYIPVSQRLGFIIFGVLAICAAAFCGAVALRLNSALARLAQYPVIFIGLEVMPIQQIVEITGHTRAQVISDLQVLIETDQLPDIYVDLQASSVISKAYLPKVSHKVVTTCSQCGQINELIRGIPKPCMKCMEPCFVALHE